MTRPIRLVGILAGIVVALTIIAFLLGGEAVERWTAARLAAPGSRTGLALLLAALLAGDIVLPVPSSLVATALGALLGGALGTLAGAAGLSLGAVAGFLAARRLGRGWVRARLGTAQSAALEAALGRWAPLVVLLCRPVPVLAEASVLVAGAAGAPAAATLAAAVLGSVAVAACYAWLGALTRDGASFLFVFAASCLLPAVAWLLATRLRRRP